MNTCSHNMQAANITGCINLNPFCYAPYYFINLRIGCHIELHIRVCINHSIFAH